MARSQPDVGIRLLYLCSKHLLLNKFLLKNRFNGILSLKDAPLKEGLSFAGWLLTHLTNIGLLSIR